MRPACTYCGVQDTKPIRADRFWRRDLSRLYCSRHPVESEDGRVPTHLVMPGLLDDTAEIARWLAKELSPATYVNIMDQYFPAWQARTSAKFANINRLIWRSEFEEALAGAREAGLWRLDRRWRHVQPRFEFVEMPPLEGRCLQRPGTANSSPQ